MRKAEMVVKVKRAMELLATNKEEFSCLALDAAHGPTATYTDLRKRYADFYECSESDQWWPDNWESPLWKSCRLTALALFMVAERHVK